MSANSAAAINSELKLFEIFQKGKYLSIKNTAYFQVYEQLFRGFVGTPVVFVEIGILNGGSLFMWREYFGQQARIIGVDLNPSAKKWQAEGFEIFIGDQSNPHFWQELFQQVGKVDVILDDGGHTNEQQIVTTVMAIPHIRDGGLLLIEDACTSYFREFGNPSRSSFISFAKRIVDAINSRYPTVNAVKSDYGSAVYSVQFFQSIVAFAIDRRRCFISSDIRNNGASSSERDFRYFGSVRETTNWYKARLTTMFPRLRAAFDVVFAVPEYIIYLFESRRVRRYFE